MKLGDYKGRKVTDQIFEKNSRFGDIRENVSRLAQNQMSSRFLAIRRSSQCILVLVYNSFNINRIIDLN